MVTRTQIAEADLTGWSGVIYTCNCGYFDLCHANPRKAAWNVGARALWQQLVVEPSDDAVVEQFRMPPPSTGDNTEYWMWHGASGYAVNIARAPHGNGSPPVRRIGLDGGGTLTAGTQPAGRRRAFRQWAGTRRRPTALASRSR